MAGFSRFSFTLKVTSGHVSDIAEAASLLHGEEQFVHGDAGYQGLDKRPEMPSENAPACVIAMRPCKLAKLTKDECEHAQLLRQAARELASRRAKVEHVFRDIKIRFGYAKNRYAGPGQKCGPFDHSHRDCQCAAR